MLDEPTTPPIFKENLDKFREHLTPTTLGFRELCDTYNFQPVTKVVAELKAKGFIVEISRKTDPHFWRDAIFRQNHLTLFVRAKDDLVVNIREG